MSLVKNKATINEDLDPSLVIRRLKAEVLSLREEIGFLKVRNVRAQVHTYVRKCVSTYVRAYDACT